MPDWEIRRRNRKTFRREVRTRLFAMLVWQANTRASCSDDH
jgi:hypothetical protein